MRFIPSKVAQGPSLIGNSYTSQYVKCPMSWFNQYKRPHEDGRGISPKFTSNFLLMGGTFHEWIAAWLASGVKDGEDTGEVNLDFSLDIARKCHLQNVKRYENEDIAEEDWLTLQGMARVYHDEFGPNGVRPDYPDIQVQVDGKGRALVEREFRVDLQYGGYVFTCRPDAIVSHHGFLKVMEHKTSAPGFWARKRLESIRTDSQFTGECMVLWSLFPEEPINGVLCNVVLKGGKVEKVLRETTTRSVADYLAFRLEQVDVLEQIDDRTARFDEDIERGIELEEAAARWFPRHGTRTGECQAYRGCQFLPVCNQKGREASTLRGYRVRSHEELTQLKEWNQ